MGKGKKWNFLSGEMGEFVTGLGLIICTFSKIILDISLAFAG